MDNVKTIHEIYAAFGRGDIPFILDQMAEAVEWEYGMTPNGLPWLQPRRGREGVAAFFKSLDLLDIRKFNPKTIIEGPGVVVALIDAELTVKKTGRPIVEEDEIHLWHFDREGHVVRFRHCVDTHQHVAAYRG
ncbi:MAG: nuclear transport factor 2 family protein [Candidatus Manganitrophaceae bacterium]